MNAKQGQRQAGAGSPAIVCRQTGMLQLARRLQHERKTGIDGKVGCTTWGKLMDNANEAVLHLPHRLR